ncbi:MULTISPECIES: phage tail assembly protein T [Pseudomonas]|uniref:Minor tail T domain-containing protein n=1 Tax=Pseudomonas luteola TaxID=47886 RepID=A0ABS0FPL0_PSELU|nr:MULTISPECIES: hypothetical protein [Pseudomonas]MBF8642255.1 hypothetical protein [Pseudomonas zeshuii]RRW48358.1 hypothetical protein EGJ50_10395 [Pseudomonas luteola]SHJ24764.1 hypothetical protein SAMN05216295_109240 [Pseudomonas zeshuii]
MNGIGGRTIAEAQEVLSYSEFMTWLKYRAKRGSLNLGMRIERGSAQLAVLYANAHKSKEVTQPYQLHDFAPYHDKPQLTLDDLANWT